MQLLAFLAENTFAFAAFSALLGLLVGSFLNVVVYRLPKMMELEWQEQCKLLLAEDQENKENHPDNPTANATSAPLPNEQSRFNLFFPNSHCPQCDHEIKPWENIPVLSFLLLKGRCSQCQCKISFRYPGVELITGLLSAVVAYMLGPSWSCLAVLFLTWALIVLTLIDFDHMLLPDEITLLLLWAGLIVNINGLFVPLEQAVLGAGIGYVSLWSVYWLFKLLTGKEGMGYGDFKLLAMLGAWMGWQLLPLIIVLSSIVGAFVGVFLIFVKGRDKQIPIPFGPYLAAAGWIAMLWGDTIMAFYLSASRL